MKKKLLKIVSTSTLAVIMGAGGLCGTIIPINSPQTAMSGASTAGATASSNSAQLGDSALNASGVATQENLVAGEAIQLNPQTDETIFTTESGFEIKSHTVAGQTLANSKVQYFTLGSYNGTPLNWIILAGSTTMTETSTPAGTAINADSSKQTLSMMTDSKLSANQILVISEKVFDDYHSFNLVCYSSKRTASTPAGASSEGGNWGGYGVSTGEGYAKQYATTLLDNQSDYYASYTGDFSGFANRSNELVLNNATLSLYIGNQIVKNSNFNSNYAFLLNNAQINTYLPTALRPAKNSNGDNCAYWCPTNIVSSVSYSITTSTDSRVSKASGNGTLAITGEFVNSNGIITSLGTIKGTLSNETSRLCYYYTANSLSRYYIYKPTCTYSSSGITSITAYYRPAMVIDISKF